MPSLADSTVSRYSDARRARTTNVTSFVAVSSWRPAWKTCAKPWIGWLWEAERVRFMEVEITDSHRIPGLLEEFVDTIKRVGPNPFKGF